MVATTVYSVVYSFPFFITCVCVHTSLQLPKWTLLQVADAAACEHAVICYNMKWFVTT